MCRLVLMGHRAFVRVRRMFCWARHALHRWHSLPMRLPAGVWVHERTECGVGVSACLHVCMSHACLTHWSGDTCRPASMGHRPSRAICIHTFRSTADCRHCQACIVQIEKVARLVALERTPSRRTGCGCDSVDPPGRRTLLQRFTHHGTGLFEPFLFRRTANYTSCAAKQAQSGPKCPVKRFRVFHGFT